MASFKRTDRIAGEIQRALGEMIRELKDPRIPLMTSVVAVEVSGDLRYAKAMISVMGDSETKAQAIKGLKSAAGFLRRELGSRIRLRTTPEIIFEASDSIEHGAHINELLHQVMKEAPADVPDTGTDEGGN